MIANTNWLNECGLLPPKPAELQTNKVEEPNVSEAHPGFVATFSGKLFDVLRPDPTAVDMSDIAHALSQINRFAGHTRFPYSVGQHSTNCLMVCEDRYPDRPELGMACLMHDAAEAYCCDVIRPIKRLLRGSCYGQIEDGTQAAIWQAIGLTVSAEMHTIVKQIDNEVVMAESQQLMVGSESWYWGDTVPAFIGKIENQRPSTVCWWFLFYFHRLYRAMHGREFKAAA